MKAIKYYIILLTGLIIFLSSTALLYKDTEVNNVFNAKKRYDNSKIIKFDHKLHVKDAGVACADCHSKANTSVSEKDNLNPVKPFCATCHDVNDTKNCNFCHYDGVLKKLRASDMGIYFNHQYHVNTEKQPCTSCHIGLENVKFSKEAPLAFPPMNLCYTCHNFPNDGVIPNRNTTSQASNNCETCHKDMADLRPKSHTKSSFLNEHKTVFDVNDPHGINSGQNCMMCHTNNFCEVCHTPVKFQGSNLSNNFYAPYYTKEGATRVDRAELQKLTTVHKDLNYRFTHGLEASSHSFECRTCHDPQEFCASCHMNDGEILTGFLPSSHQQPLFVTSGPNTGGGLHALLGKRDIESCQSCHDASGTDPVCMRCHFDPDGVKGTNPRTHEPGFMTDEKGIWHDTQGAVCYVCHYDANARPDGQSGRGFCGYCHN